MNKYLCYIILVVFCIPPTISFGGDGRCIEGDCLNGKGIYSYSNGEKYEGQFKDGERHGRGILNFPDGNKYIGQFKNGKRHGQGILNLPDGSYYMGEWKDDLPKEQRTEKNPDDTKDEAASPVNKKDESESKEIFPQNLETSNDLEYASIFVGANIRSNASLKSGVLRTVPPGYPVVILERKTDWLLIEDYLGRKGWVFASLVTDPKTVIIKVSKGNLRSGPSLQDDIIVQLDNGTIMSVLEKKGGWLKVSDKKELTGWLHQKIVWPAVEMND
jgi:SH3-like domain-containing protein